MYEILAGMATNLPSMLLVAAGQRVRDEALGGEQERALAKVFEEATAVVLVEATRHDREDRSLPDRLGAEFGKFYRDRWVAETLVGVALSKEDPPFEKLRRRFGEVGGNADALPIDFGAALELLVYELADRLRKEASRAGSPLNNLVQVAELGAIRENLEELVRGLTGNVVTYEYIRPNPIDPALLEQGQRLLEELPLDYVPEGKPLPPGSVGPPMDRNPLFVGREEDLKELAEKLKGDDSTAGPVKTVGVYGLGGVGKTQLASEFAYSYGQFFEGGVYWLNLSNPDAVAEEIARCGGAGAMELRGDFDRLSLEDQVRRVKSEWQNELPRLLVLDNCEDRRSLRACRPTAGGCRVLLTSRGPITDRALGVVAFALEPLVREASVELLRKYCDGTGARDADLDEIAAELGDLPLALDLAGRYLRRYRHITGPGRYPQELRSEEVLSHRSLQQDDEREVSPTGHEMDVGRTFIVGLRRLDGGDPTDHLAVRLLARAARFAPGELIDRGLLLSTLGSADEVPTVRQLEEREDALLRLVELGWVTELQMGQVRMHKLVAEFARRETGDGEAQSSVERAVANRGIEVANSGQPATFVTLLPHLRYVTDVARDRDDEPAYLARYALGAALFNLGSYAEAVPYWESAVRYNTARLGATDWLTMRQRNDLGVAMKRAGDLEGALSVYEPLLEDQRNELEQPHEDVASTLLNIGSLTREQGLLHEVLPRYEEALDIRERVLARMDADDAERRQLLRDVAESHDNLGALSMDLGRPREAAPRFERALGIYEGLEETLHERYAKTTMELGAALGLLGDFQGARSRLEYALRVHREVLPEGHPEIARNLTLLGTLLAEEAHRNESLPDEQEREILGCARACLEEAVSLSESSYGGNHPLTAGILRAAADVAEAKGRSEVASSWHEQADAIRSSNLQGEGADSSYLRKAVIVFAEWGLYDEAVFYQQRSLELLRSSTQGEDIEVATAEFALGCLLQLRGRNEKAAAHLERALLLREQLLGGDHPATELARDSLSYLRERGR